MTKIHFSIISASLGLLMAFVSMSPAQAAEEVTLSALYPSPFGEYDKLNSSGNTNLATKTGASKVVIGRAGSSPSGAMLHVSTMNCCSDADEGIRIRNDRGDGTAGSTGSVHLSIFTNRLQQRGSSQFIFEANEGSFYFKTNPTPSSSIANMTTRLFIEAASGNLGVGTESPLGSLHLRSTDPRIILNDTTPTAGSSRITFSDTGGTLRDAINWTAADDLLIQNTSASPATRPGHIKVLTGNANGNIMLHTGTTAGNYSGTNVPATERIRFNFEGRTYMRGALDFGRGTETGQGSEGSVSWTANNEFVLFGWLNKKLGLGANGRYQDLLINPDATVQIGSVIANSTRTNTDMLHIRAVQPRIFLDKTGTTNLGVPSPDPSNRGAYPANTAVASPGIATEDSAGTYVRILTYTQSNNLILQNYDTNDPNGCTQIGARNKIQFINGSQTAATEKMVILSDGTVGINTTAPSPTYKLDVSGKGRFTLGVFTNAGMLITSDARLKTNIQPIRHGLDDILKLQGVRFDWKEGQPVQGHDMGLLAQDVEKVFPEIVKTDDQGIKALDYSKLTAVLIEAVKELRAEVRDLEARLESQRPSD